jgi:putative ABC transport system permease protein
MSAPMTTLHSALRSLLRSPRLSLAAIACIGLGAAATAAVATLVGATVMRPLPFPDADRLVRIWWEDGANPRVSLSIPELRDCAALASFDVLLGTARVRAVVTFDGGAERVRGEGVTPGYFETLGIRPGVGRLLEDADHRADAPRVMVISQGLWTRHYGGDPHIVGRTLRTDRAAYTVVGVASGRFAGTVEDDIVEFWIPLSQYEPASMLQDRSVRQSWAIGRLREGSSAAAAGAEAASLGESLARQYPDAYKNLRLRVEPMGENWRSSFRRSGLLLSGAAALLLLVAAVNVAGLLLARVLTRRRELAVRAALGAGRPRLIRQLLLEAVLLVAAGGALGLLAAPVVLQAFLSLSPVALPPYLHLEPDAAALLASMVALGVTGLLAGTAPALVGSRVEPGEVLKDDARGSVGSRVERRWGGALVAIEIALTLVLLVFGGLLLRSWERQQSAELGYRSDGIARLAVTMSAQDVRDPAAIPAFRESLRAAVAAHPGVEQVGLVWLTLPPWDSERFRVRFDGLDPALAVDGLLVGAHLADAGLLPTLGIAIVSGRNLEETDLLHGRNVAVVSRSLAERMGGPDRAMGRELVLPDATAGMPTGAFRVVGVAENVAWDGTREQDTRRFLGAATSDPRAARDDVYLPLGPFRGRAISIAAYTRGDEGALLEPLRRRIAQLAPTSAVHWTSTMRDELAGEYESSRFYALIVAAFSTSALLLTAVGVFAVLSHGVARRTNEIGLRMALGATPRHIARLVLGGALVPLSAGVAAGLIGAVVFARATAGLLYGIEPLDLLSFFGASAVLLVVALPAGWLPARRAASLEPMKALRE